MPPQAGFHPARVRSLCRESGARRDRQRSSHHRHHSRKDGARRARFRDRRIDRDRSGDVALGFDRARHRAPAPSPQRRRRGHPRKPGDRTRPTLLNETTHDLASTLALQDLLRTIVSRARSLVGANVAYLTRLNEDHSIMRTVAAEGLISPGTWELSANIGIGAVSLIVTSKSFFDTQDYLGDQRFRHSRFLRSSLQGRKHRFSRRFPDSFGRQTAGHSVCRRPLPSQAFGA